MRCILITGVKLGNEGQGLLELIFAVPVFIGFVWIFFKVNSAIQVSINNQQHSRGQILHLAFNSAVFPELKFRLGSSGMASTGAPNQFTAGTSADHVEPDSPVNATVVSLARSPAQEQGESIQSLPGQVRTNIRIRDTVTICTQKNDFDSNPKGGYCL